MGVTLLSSKGYFRQELEPNTGNQLEHPVEWDHPHHLDGPLPAKIQVEVEGRTVHVQAWQHTLTGGSGSTVPVVYAKDRRPE